MEKLQPDSKEYKEKLRRAGLRLGEHRPLPHVWPTNPAFTRYLAAVHVLWQHSGCPLPIADKAYTDYAEERALLWVEMVKAAAGG